MLAGIEERVQKRFIRLQDRQQRKRNQIRGTRLASGDHSGFLRSIGAEFPEALQAVEQYLKHLERDLPSEKFLLVSHLQTAGRIESFHHFLGALLFPLILYQSDFGFKPGTILHIQDCGNLNHYAKAVAEHFGLEVYFFPAEIAQSLYHAFPEKLLGLPPFDGSKNSDYWLHSHEIEVLRAFGSEFASANQTPRIPILLVSRGESASVFASPRFQRLYNSYRKWNITGASRRHIPNETELVAKLEAIDDTTVATLEGMSLADQIALFRRADVIIGQHGAGLNGILWCDAGVSVLELLPKEMIGTVWTYFRNMAERLNQRHTFMIQNGPHQTVDADAIARFAARRLESTRHMS